MDEDLMDRSDGDQPPEHDFLDLRLDGSTDVETEPVLEIDDRTSSESGPLWSPGSSPAAHPRAGSRRAWLWILVMIAFPLGGLIGYGLKAGPALAELSLELMDFGEMRVASSSQLTIDIASRGETALEVAAVAIGGAEREDFVLLTDGCSKRRVPSGERCSLTIGFTPVEPGQRRARLVLTSNATVEPTNTPLLGVGTAPGLRAEPAKLDFLERKVGRASAPARFWLASTGTAAATVDSLKVDGPASSDFVVASDACSGTTLQPGERCGLEVLFIPRQAGPRRATIVALSDMTTGTGTGSVLECELFGHGLELRPGLRTDLDHIEFGEVPIGSEEPIESVVLSSAGDGALEIRSISISGDGGFQVVAKNCGALAPDEHCRIDVRFAPTGEEEARATLEIRHNAATGVARVLLTGTGTQARLSLDPTRISFGEVSIGRVSASRLLKVANAGSGELEVVSANIQGADAGVFRIDRQSCGSKVLRGNHSAERCSFEIGFKPRRRGPHRAELVIDADGASSLVAALNGLGVESQLEIFPGRVEMGEIELGRYSSSEVRLSNAGRAPLSIQSVALRRASSSDFDIVSDRCGGSRLESSRSCTFRVRFEPTRVGLRSVQLIVTHDGREGQRTVSVQANGREQARPLARVEPRRLELEGLRVGQLSPIRTVTVSNDGTAPLALRPMRIVGPNAGDFYTVSGSCEGLTELAPGRDCTLGIRFEPAEIGPRRAELLIRHDAAGGSERIALFGEAF